MLMKMAHLREWNTSICIVGQFIQIIWSQKHFCFQIFFSVISYSSVRYKRSLQLLLATKKRRYVLRSTLILGEFQSEEKTVGWITLCVSSIVFFFLVFSIVTLPVTHVKTGVTYSYEFQMVINFRGKE